MEVKDLQPKAVFEIFDQITKIPRPSKKEEKIRKYILDFAKEHGIDAAVVLYSVPNFVSDSNLVWLGR